MCGRFALPDETVVARNIPVKAWSWHWPKPRFNVAPTTKVPIVLYGRRRTAGTERRQMGPHPPLVERKITTSLTFNARSEDAAEKPTWRHSLRSMRCLMPARGWYEWNENEQVRNEGGRKVKQPYFSSLPKSDFMAFAGSGLSGRAKTAPRSFHVR
jgi:putative SOS response-associated peptidase YedK